MKLAKRFVCSLSRRGRVREGETGIECVIVGSSIHVMPVGYI